MLVLFLLQRITALPAIPSRVLGVWHCGEPEPSGIFCSWFHEPHRQDSQWLNKTVNVVSITFLNPQPLLNETTSDLYNRGVPRGLTGDYVAWLQKQGIRVFFAIGGVVHSRSWELALVEPGRLARNVARVANDYGVGIEIDYEGEDDIALANLEIFIREYRQLRPFKDDDISTYLTVDNGANLNYVMKLASFSAHWLRGGLINWINALVAPRPDRDASSARANWNQHLNGAPGIPAVFPEEMTGGLWISQGGQCEVFQGTPFAGLIDWVHNNGFKGLYFWANGCVGPHIPCITHCPGVEQGAKEFFRSLQKKAQ